MWNLRIRIRAKWKCRLPSSRAFSSERLFILGRTSVLNLEVRTEEAWAAMWPKMISPLWLVKINTVKTCIMSRLWMFFFFFIFPLAEEMDLQDKETTPGEILPVVIIGKHSCRRLWALCGDTTKVNRRAVSLQKRKSFCSFYGRLRHLHARSTSRTLKVQTPPCNN